MKKLIALFLLGTFIFSAAMFPVQAADGWWETTSNLTDEEGAILFANISPLESRYPEIRLIDRHFKAYRDAGAIDEKPDLLPGDVNIDGEVNAVDGLYAMIYGLSTTHWIDRNGERHYAEPVSNNLYYRGIYNGRVNVQGMAMKSFLEKQMIEYHTDAAQQTTPINEQGLKLLYYRMNSALMADVNLDDQCNAVDTLYILQYAVGKIDRFPRTDCSDTDTMFYVPWPDEWEPKMLYSLDDSQYEGLAN